MLLPLLDSLQLRLAMGRAVRRLVLHAHRVAGHHEVGHAQVHAHATGARDGGIEACGLQVLHGSPGGTTRLACVVTEGLPLFSLPCFNTKRTNERERTNERHTSVPLHVRIGLMLDGCKQLLEERVRAHERACLGAAAAAPEIGRRDLCAGGSWRHCDHAFRLGTRDRYTTVRQCPPCTLPAGASDCQTATRLSDLARHRNSSVSPHHPVPARRLTRHCDRDLPLQETLQQALIVGPKCDLPPAIFRQRWQVT